MSTSTNPTPAPAAQTTVPWMNCIAVNTYNPTSTGLGQNWAAAIAAFVADPANNRQVPPPYDPTKPVQLYNWSEVAGDAVPCFAANSPATAYVVSFAPQPKANIPGARTYPARTIAALPSGQAATYPFVAGFNLPVPVDYIESQADAESTLKLLLASPDFATMKVIPDWEVGTPNAAGVPEQVNITWNAETRRYFHVSINGGSPINLAILTTAINSNGVGYPIVALTWTPPPGSTIPSVQIEWGEPVVNPPANYTTAPIPLLPGVPPAGYAFSVVGLFNQSIVLAPIVPASPTPAQQLAAALIQQAAINAEVAALQVEVAAG